MPTQRTRKRAHPGPGTRYLPAIGGTVIEGTLIRLQVEHLPGDRDPKPA